MVKIPESLTNKLGPEMKMDCHWVDVKLSNGDIFKNMVVRGNKYIAGFHDDQNGEGDVPFESKDIVDIRRHSIFPFW
jgi:hypothetical protein